MSEKVTGAALVVGGGIAGMQAALDLAESGFYVYLVEKSPSIGGTMARLDKTFPTNDCAMCILSPKLVECGRHLNIETLTGAEVVDVTGRPGAFKVVVRRHPRYIDVAKCTGCGDCEKECPVRKPNEYEGGLSLRKAVFRPFPQAYPNAFAIEKAERPMCQVSCPAGVHAQGYVALVAEGKFKEAVALVRRHNPLPAVCGRVCHHPCEAACRRGLVDEAVAIRPLKRFIADYEHEQGGEPLTVVTTEPRPERVAVVGSGPAGITAAHYLALDGFKVTVFESLPVAGGMLAVGIPDYRLPRDILTTEIGQVEAMGVEIRTGTALGRDFSLDDLKARGYAAVFLAVGAHLDQKLDLPGEDIPGVVSGVEFLRHLNLDQEVRVGQRVLVIGGGNVAIDAARSCLRRGAAAVTVVYRRSRGEMPAAPHEVTAAEEEGIGFEFLTAPTAVRGQGRVEGLRCLRMQLGEADASGRRRPLPVPGSDFTLEADQVIVAVGQSADTSFAGEELVDRWGNLAADAGTLATALPGVFAGGDAVTGPATVVEAIAAGRQAAVSIRRYLDGQDLAGGVVARPAPVVGPVRWDAPRLPRATMRELEPGERRRDFREVELGLDQQEAMAEAGRCLDCGVCAECLECERVCRAGAVVHDMQEETVELEVGAVVLCPGFAATESQHMTHLGYGRFANVVTSVEFERILSASGPFEGHVVRPSDRQTPKRIAFLQCVGSRDVRNGEGYCSSVCCMYALKEAVIAKEHSSEELDISILYMDMRAHGKDFEHYLNRAQQEYGVRLVRGKVEAVEPGSTPGGLTVRYAAEDGPARREEFDLVVLSVGMRPQPEVVDLARRLGISTDEHGFPRAVPGQPTRTSLPGILVAGPFAAPKDIPETVVEASAAAAEAGTVLAPARGELVRGKEYPPERPVANRAPRIGVFVCHCGINIGGVVRVKEVVEYARGLPGVVHAEDNLYTCSQDTQDHMKELIREHDLNRVVVASCSPRTHEPLFQQTIREGGLNPYLFEMANIRDQCSWVHMQRPDEATAKSRDLVAMAVAKARHLEPLYRVPVPVTPGALVIGGGMAGLTAALGFARQGFPACLVERDAELGGQARRLRTTLEGENVPALMAAAAAEARSHRLITIHTGSEVRSVEGFVGNFESHITTPGGEVTLKHGVVVVATGAGPAVPAGFGYGEDARVMTQLELEESLDRIPPGDVVMIGCAGSRETGRPYCSRICCSHMVKNALALRRAYPDREVYVLYRDMRTYGLKEDHYREARAAGVTFLRYRAEQPPAVTGSGGQLQVEVFDETLGDTVAIPAGVVALATGVQPPDDARVLAQTLKVPLNADGFFLEAHVKLRPVDFATDGVFVAGLAHAPKSLAESVAQAQAAVGRAVTVVARDSIEAGGVVAEVREGRCSGCRTCESVCQYQAIKVDPAKGKAAVEKAVCKGCGACAATCWCGAITLRGFTEEQILAEVAALL
ncbi:MAG: FAD-dependent oxidoreductase [bacterium]|nr:FAD-dependent oxidoreductase [bacterium]